jgi:glycosyltransferase involved in cell wall biosynthesis
MPEDMLSVIIPVHNESATLEGNLSRLKASLDVSGADYEAIIAEDGSDDGSKGIAESFASRNVGFRAMSSKVRQGRGVSLSESIRASKGDIVVYMDADMATDLRHLPELVREIEKGADISTGSRLMKGSVVSGRSIARDFFSKGYNALLRLMFNTRIRDHQCGFKAFRKSSILGVLGAVQDKHWFWDSELLIRAQAKGLRVSEIPIRWSDRKGSSMSLPWDIIQMGAAAFRLRLQRI